MDLATLIAFLIVGLSVGFIARLLVPGPDPMGWIGTIVLGSVGSFVAGSWVACASPAAPCSSPRAGSARSSAP